jgi:type IV secretory pathway TrbL component
MLEQAATLFVYAIGLYGAIGFLFSIAFVVVGVSRIDLQAVGTGIFFRLLILPGCVALWPLLLRRWIAGKSDPPAEKVLHR